MFREGIVALLRRTGRFAAVSVRDLEDLPDAARRERAGVAVVDLSGDPKKVDRIVARLISDGVRVIGTGVPARHERVRVLPKSVIRRAFALDDLVAALDASPDLVAPTPPPLRLAQVSSGELTTRERQVLALIGAGCTCGEIATRLRISAKTVESRRQSIFAKLGVQSQAHAVAVARRSGAIDNSPPAQPPIRTRRRAHPEREYGRPAIHVRSLAAGTSRIVVAHEQQWVAALVSDVLGATGEVVGVTSSGEGAARLCEVYRPDVLLAGEVLDDGVVDTFLARIVRTGARVMLLAEPLELARSLGLVERGVTGLIDSTLAPDELGEAVRAAARGAAILSPELMGAITGEWRLARRTHGVVKSSGQLTAREVEILGTLVDGLATKAIGHLLGVSVKTVENHKTRIFAKLGVRSQAEAVSMVLEGRYRPEIPLSSRTRAADARASGPTP